VLEKHRVFSKGSPYTHEKIRKSGSGGCCLSQQMELSSFADVSLVQRGRHWSKQFSNSIWQKAGPAIIELPEFLFRGVKRNDSSGKKFDIFCHMRLLALRSARSN
jgi:hypothetical protein